MIAVRRRISNRRENSSRIDAVDPPQAELQGRSLACFANVLHERPVTGGAVLHIDPIEIGRLLWTFLIMIGTITSKINSCAERIASLVNCREHLNIFCNVRTISFVIAFIICLRNFSPYRAMRTLAGKVGRLKRKAGHPVVAIRCCHPQCGWCRGWQQWYSKLNELLRRRGRAVDLST